MLGGCDAAKSIPCAASLFRRGHFRHVHTLREDRQTEVTSWLLSLVVVPARLEPVTIAVQQNIPVHGLTHKRWWLSCLEDRREIQPIA